MSKPKRKPAYTLHKPSGNARVRIDGKDHYLGPYNSPESRERYDDLIAEWFAKQGDVDAYSLRIDDLALLYLAHADEYYRQADDGNPTRAADNIRDALRPLIARFGRLRVRDFGPSKLMEVRADMIDAGYVRTSINGRIGRIKRMFKWGVACEHVPVEVYQALVTVEGLKRGRSKAKESAPVRPVATGTVDDTLPHLPKVVGAMVRLQLLTGARPSEICILRPCDVTIGTDGVWTYRPESHKTFYRGKERRIFIGPEGQEVLRPYLEREPEAYCFSPIEAEAERNAQKRASRKSPMTPSQAARKPKPNRTRPPRERYDKNSYGRAIRRACCNAGLEVWSPNQLRHSRATMLRERYGLEAAQLVLGHSDPKTTQIYAERNFEAAARIMREIG